MTDNLDARELLEGTTPGPWQYQGGWIYHAKPMSSSTVLQMHEPAFFPNAADLSLLLAAPDLARRVIEQDARIAKLEEQAAAKDVALTELDQWSSAYPVDIFLEPDLEAVTATLKAAGLLVQMDRMHSSWARRLLEGVGGIARAALNPTPVEEAGK